MKKCPSCGNEIEEDQSRCPQCGHMTGWDAGSAKEIGVKGPDLEKIQEMRKRIRRLSKTISENAAEASTIESQKMVESERQEEIAKAEPTEPKPDIEELLIEEPEEEGRESIPDESEGDTRSEIEDEISIAEPPPEIAEREVEPERAEVSDYRLPIRGAINGLGIIFPKAKETGISEEQEPDFISHSKSRIGKKIAIVVLIIILILAAIQFIFFYGLSTPSDDDPRIDGRFDDWATATTYGSLIESDNTDIDFAESAVQFSEGQLFWYFMTHGSLYPSLSHITSYALFVDSDGDSGTGFILAEDFGADMMITISGIGDKQLTDELSKFSGTDRSNWSGWITVIDSLNFRETDNQGEVSFHIPSDISFSTSSSRFIGVAYDGLSKSSMTPMFSLSPGVLVVTQHSLIPSSGVIDIGPEEAILELSLRGFGDIHSIDAINPFLVNCSMDGNLEVNWATPDEMDAGVDLILIVNTSSTPAGSKIYAEALAESFVTEFPSIMILGKPAIGYVEALPDGITIDGCFADWNNLTTDLDILPVDNLDIDINKIGCESDSLSAYFYAEVKGEMMAGVFIPVGIMVESFTEPVPSPSALSRISGEDILCIYVDIDPNASSGAPSPITEEDIRPDYLIEVWGRNGIIKSEMLFEWNGKWDLVSSTDVIAANDDARIEVGIAKGILGGNLSQAEMLVQMTDWIDYEDHASIIGPLIDPFIIDETSNVWGSLDGTSWEVKTDVLPAGPNLMDLTSDDSGYLYAMYDNGTVYRSIDLALSWSRIIDGTSTITETAVGITCDRSLNLYLLTDRAKVYRELVTGGTWTQMGQAPGAPNNYEDIDWANGTSPSSTVIYAIKSDDSPLALSLSRSDDGGATWTPISLPSYDEKVTAVAAVRISGNDRIYLLEIDGDVQVSNNSGTSWESTHISAGGSGDCRDLDTDENNDVWVARNKGDIYRLNVSTWTWTTLYSSSDKSAIITISTVPIPEFDQSHLFLIMIGVIAIGIRIRKREINREKKSH